MKLGSGLAQPATSSSRASAAARRAARRRPKFTTARATPTATTTALAQADPGSAVTSRVWQHIKRLLTVAFFLLVCALMLRQGRNMNWAAVGAAMASYSLATLVATACIAAASHAIVASFELIGRHLTGHSLPASRTWSIGAVSYAFNLNLGSLVGGLALRTRLYTRAGLKLPQVSQIIACSVVTNWVGYLALGGVLFAMLPVDVPAGWRIDSNGLRWIGFSMLSLAAAYMLATALAPQRRWELRGHVLRTPSLRTALLQLVVSSVNWMLIGTTVWLALGHSLPWHDVMAVFLVAAVAGVITHVPGNIGVLEAVFIALLSDPLLPQHQPAEQLLAGLIVFRVVYYLLPLLVACAGLFKLERLGRHELRQRQRGAGRPGL